MKARKHEEEPPNTKARRRALDNKGRIHDAFERLRMGVMTVAAGVVGVSLAAQAPALPASPGVPNPPEITAKDLADGLKNPSRWLTYSGDYTGQRHSPLKQITSSNAHQLVTQWTFQNGVSTPTRFSRSTPIRAS